MRACPHDRLCDADDAGVRYFGLAALNKAEWLNHGGSDILKVLGERKIRIVHGNTLTAAAIWHAVGESTTAAETVFVSGATSKIGRVLCILLARVLPVGLVQFADWSRTSRLSRASLCFTRDGASPAPAALIVRTQRKLNEDEEDCSTSLQRG